LNSHILTYLLILLTQLFYFLLIQEGGRPHNWGKPTDVLAELDEHYEFKEETPKYNKEKVQDTKAAETNRETGRLGKIQVVKPEEFEELHRASNS
jgi:hypothetical protein